MLSFSETLCAQALLPSYVSEDNVEGSFPIIVNGRQIPILFDEGDHKGVVRAVKNLMVDFEKVSGSQSVEEASKTKIIVGTVGKSKLIDRLVKSGLVQSSELLGKNEKYIAKIVDRPIDGVEKAFVIAGSDKRGTIYGVYELSRQIGVSPWYYWADVPIAQKQNLFIKPGLYTEGEPAVRYRGIFLNDEAPALTGWANSTFGGYNSKFYEKVFELLLRLKANFLWPAMWGNAFYDDDPLNGELADEMGIVMSTSHHEPMARAQQEWKRYGNGGSWDYSNNKKGLQEFWRGGMERTKDWESVITIAMRGDGDEPMSEDQNKGLLETIVKDQRKIIADVTGKRAEKTPQVWALYKEVQDYYDSGMRVPEDVTLLFCDDNWGNVRKLPELDAKPREGGYGMYYHFDYVGGPRNSKWLNVNQIQRVWEQMNLSYRHGVDRIWVVNVGDLKPMEYPISFFLEMAWDPDQFKPDNLYLHTVNWSRQQFGAEYADQAARMIDTYTKYNHRVTPELLNDKTYSLENYDEFETVVNDYRKLLTDAFRVYQDIPMEYKAAFDQLVLFPINATSNLYDMYFALAKNRQLSSENSIEANMWADEVKRCFERDSILTVHYNTKISNGKWAHMMDQVRIGYTSWNNPPRNILPKTVIVDSTANSKIFVENEGYVSIEAKNYFSARTDGSAYWVEIPNLGKTESAITTFPVDASLEKNTSVTFKFDVRSTGDAKLWMYTSPTLNFNANKGLRFSVKIDDDGEQVINLNGHYKGELGQWQAERMIKTSVDVSIPEAGEHTITIRPLEHGIVLQKIILDFGGLKKSYLGAPQSKTK